MQKIRYGIIVLWLLLCLVITAEAQVNVSIGLPNVSIGINFPLFPHLVPVPGYPVYYAPQVDANYFFYDGMYWVYHDDNWYASAWYNGPWSFVAPEVVPLFVLRIPVRYYRQPPLYFSGWQTNAPPRWGHHWGHGWEQDRRGWDKWQRSSVPKRAPLPVYQQRYSGDRYPQPQQQHNLRKQHNRYQPRDKVIRQHLKQQVEQKAPAAVQHDKQAAPPVKSVKQPESRRPAPTPAVQTQPPAQRKSVVHEKQQQPAKSDSNQQLQRDNEKNRKTVSPQPPVQKQHPAVDQQKPRPGRAEHKGQPQGERDKNHKPAPAVHEKKQQPGAMRHEQQPPGPIYAEQPPKSQKQEQGHPEKDKQKDNDRGHGQGQSSGKEHGQGRNK